jgi:hypothetical protein
VPPALFFYLFIFTCSSMARRRARERPMASPMKPKPSCKSNQWMDGWVDGRDSLVGFVGLGWLVGLIRWVGWVMFAGESIKDRRSGAGPMLMVMHTQCAGAGQA